MYRDVVGNEAGERVWGVRCFGTVAGDGIWGGQTENGCDNYNNRRLTIVSGKDKTLDDNLF